jgi:hypothetical protein
MRNIQAIKQRVLIDFFQEHMTSLPIFIGEIIYDGLISLAKNSEIRNKDDDRIMKKIILLTLLMLNLYIYADSDLKVVDPLQTRCVRIKLKKDCVEESREWF